MSNGITTASGEVVVRGEEGERTSLGGCVMLEDEWEQEGDGESRCGWGAGGTKKGHLEMANVESEARVDLNGVVLVQGCLMEREKKLHFFL